MERINWFKQKKLSLQEKYGKEIIVTALSVFLLTIFLVGASYSIFTDVDKAAGHNTVTVGTLQINYDDTSAGLGGYIDLSNTIAITDEAGLTLTPYKFRITNNGSINAVVNLSIVDDTAAITTCGCGSNQISKSAIKYHLVRTEQALTKGPFILSISSQIDKLILAPNESATYELRMWIDNDALLTSYTDKHFHGKIEVTSTQEVNQPVLELGMIPVIISDNGIVTTADTTGEWYNYNNKEWANAVIVKNAGVKTRAENSVAGTIIDQSDILGYFVWIPRYKYKLFNVEGTPSTYTAGTCTANCPQEIEIIFETPATPKSTGTGNDTWLTHPTFTFGSKELSGIWVGKFETTGSELEPQILPNTTSLREQNVSAQFTTSRKLGNTSTTYGITADTHLAKDTDWSAIAYLSHSKYGINSEIRINNQNTYITGCGALAEDDAATATCNNAYGSVTTYPQSTTGNITGIFDMSGGAKEYTMSVLADSNDNPRSGYDTTSNPPQNSGFNGYITATETFLTTGLVFPNSKYYDLYTTTSYAMACNGNKCLGRSIGETSTWYEDSTTFASANTPWFIRGGNGIFAFESSEGHADSSRSFRIVITP